MIIKISQEDINKGLRGAIYGCPVSMALSKGTGKACLVDYDLLNIDGQNFIAPEYVREFTQVFDNDASGRKNIKPIEIDTEKLDKSPFAIRDNIGLRGHSYNLRKNTRKTFIKSMIFLVIYTAVILTLFIINK